MIERLALALLRRLPPERAHDLALTAVLSGLGPRPGPVTSRRLLTRLAGIELANPIGLAAGLDKNAVAIDGLSRAGFGWLEVGAATPRAQPGNPAPRLFRLEEDRAAINRFGFNNDGAAAIAERLSAADPMVPVGLNLGANHDSADRAADYAHVVALCGPHVSFVTVNVSSPNTAALRKLQGPGALEPLLRGVIEARDALMRPCPVFLKIAPDVDDAGIEVIAATAEAVGIDAIIATNTTLDRRALKSRNAREDGGLSGPPLWARSTRVLARFHQATGGRMPLVGVGGVETAEDAYAKIRAGATAVQIYTVMIYEGLSVAARIARGLDRLLAADGFKHATDATGVDAARYAAGRAARSSSG